MREEAESPLFRTTSWARRAGAVEPKRKQATSSFM